MPNCDILFTEVPPPGLCAPRSNMPCQTARSRRQTARATRPCPAGMVVRTDTYAAVGQLRTTPRICPRLFPRDRSHGLQRSHCHATHSRSGDDCERLDKSNMPHPAETRCGPTDRSSHDGSSAKRKPPPDPARPPTGRPRPSRHAGSQVRRPTCQLQHPRQRHQRECQQSQNMDQSMQPHMRL